MSYKSDYEKLAMFMGCIKEMTGIARQLAEKEDVMGQLEGYLEYLKYEDNPRDFDNWVNDLMWNSSMC
jgi:hypothetical protein